MQIKRLEEMFADAKGCKTRTGAEARLAKFAGWAEGVTEQSIAPRAFILTREDGTMIPVIILNEKTMWMMHYAVDCGCCVTN
jgi:hypothetical protein